MLLNNATNQEVKTATLDDFPDYVFHSDGRVSSYRRGKEKFFKQDAVNQGGYLNINLATETGGTRKYITHVLIARAFLGPRPEGFQVDHINRIKVDNRIENLRYITRSDNSRNRDFVDNSSSKFIGVCFIKKTAKWLASIRLVGKNKRLGVFTNEEDAARAYDAVAVKAGRKPNFPVE